MTPRLAINDPDVTIYHGDVHDVLAALPSSSVQLILSSPPFWGLRDYGTATWTGGDAACDHAERELRRGVNLAASSASTRGGAKKAAEVGWLPYRGTCGKCGAERADQQIGLEETPDAWAARLVAVYREARRVLRDDGCMFIEIGDSYVSGQGGRQSAVGELPHATRSDRTEPASRPDLENPPAGWSTRQVANRTYPQRDTGLKPKDLVGQPWLLAFALRADGWYLRSEIIWHRPNPMPESITDRPTKAHSTVFLLTKQPRYFYDADAIRDAAAHAGKTVGSRSAPDDGYHRGGPGRFAGEVPATANARSVWPIPTEATPFAHFATWPQTLAERMIKAGTSEHGCCSTCGAPWRRIADRETIAEPRNATSSADAHGPDGRDAKRASLAVTTTGWEPTCAHADAPVTPCTILDPFMGSGTSALVARRLGRHAVGAELNADYCAIAATRLQQLSLLA